jgi:anti-sigma regulatory factor (Ser/Thr protein kinase)
VPTLAAPARARAAVTDWLAPRTGDELFMDLVLLLVSELVTNSIRHASLARDQPLRLDGSLGEARLRIALWDSGTVGRVERTRRRDDDLGGFGLDLVARLSSDWGVERDAYGTTVWPELPTPADAAS